ncbi:hypothetical protein [Aurantivibrio plasticivorans]
MDIRFTKRKFLEKGLSEPAGPFRTELGYFLFVEAACFYGVLPPFTMLNSMLREGKIISTKNYLLEWQPFRMTRIDYEELKWAIQDNPTWGGEVDEGYRGSRKYWSRWAMLRTLDKQFVSA